MKVIIRNTSHGNGIVVARIIDEGLRTLFIEKSSTLPRGVGALQNEYQGFLWYNQSLGKRLSIAKEEAAKRFCLRLGFVDGETADYRDGLLKNEAVISDVIRHYCQIWGKLYKPNESAAVHGDLSLSNVIMGREGPVLIDWEHYRAKALPLGFDALYLLFVSLFFEITNKERPSSMMIGFIGRQIKFIKNQGCLSHCFERTPLAAVVDCIHKNRAIWDLTDDDIGRKLPILQWSKSTIEHIDEELKNNERTFA